MFRSVQPRGGGAIAKGAVGEFNPIALGDILSGVSSRFAEIVKQLRRETKERRGQIRRAELAAARRHVVAWRHWQDASADSEYAALPRPVHLTSEFAIAVRNDQARFKAKAL